MSRIPEVIRGNRHPGFDLKPFCKAGPQTHALKPVAEVRQHGADTRHRDSSYLTNNEAATYLRLSPRTLEKLRITGGGPRFHKFGRRVMYALLDLETWANERSFETTFDPDYVSRHPRAHRDDL